MDYIRNSFPRMSNFADIFVNNVAECGALGAASGGMVGASVGAVTSFFYSCMYQKTCCHDDDTNGSILFGIAAGGAIGVVAGGAVGLVVGRAVRLLTSPIAVAARRVFPGLSTIPNEATPGDNLSAIEKCRSFTQETLLQEAERQFQDHPFKNEILEEITCVLPKVREHYRITLGRTPQFNSEVKQKKYEAIENAVNSFFDRDDLFMGLDIFHLGGCILPKHQSELQSRQLAQQGEDSPLINRAGYRPAVEPTIDPRSEEISKAKALEEESWGPMKYDSRRNMYYYGISLDELQVK
ncbi:MAG: hypothetical protein WCF65_05680 [Parachlamydiaceae bacterium]